MCIRDSLFAECARCLRAAAGADAPAAGEAVPAGISAAARVAGRESPVCFMRGHDVRRLRDGLVLDGGWQALDGDLDGCRNTWQAGAQELPVGPGTQKP
eukprot:3086925-Alexandrium_andersonii.AAC.1